MPSTTLERTTTAVVQPKQAPRGVRLTPTEILDLSAIAEGLSSKEAANRRYVSKRTIDFHLYNIYVKLGVHNRVQAIREARRLGLIPFEPTWSERFDD